MPVWGFATVAESRVDGLAGGRAHLRLSAAFERAARGARSASAPHGFVDASPHRAELPAAYNSYSLTAADPVYDAGARGPADAAAPAVLHLLADRRLPARQRHLRRGHGRALERVEQDGERLAFLLSREGGVEVVGLSSARGGGVRALDRGLRRRAEPTTRPATCRPGAPSTWTCPATPRCARPCTATTAASWRTRRSSARPTTTRWAPCPRILPGPRPTFFFAPDRVAKRSAEWGREQLERRLAEAWQPYVELDRRLARGDPRAGARAPPGRLPGRCSTDASTRLARTSSHCRASGTSLTFAAV